LNAHDFSEVVFANLLLLWSQKHGSIIRDICGV
jgi:hypothetical protein